MSDNKSPEEKFLLLPGIPNGAELSPATVRGHVDPEGDRVADTPVPERALEAGA
ncbi:MAG: hypothetical protein Q8P67_11925 [archaeon]|nr:hypothetical protein [archaeon]